MTEKEIRAYILKFTRRKAAHSSILIESLYDSSSIPIKRKENVDPARTEF